MKIQKIENQKHTPSFGTYLGINMQEKVMLAKQRNVFTSEQIKNLEKLEDNGIDVFLELADKYVISSVNNKKGTMKIKKILTLTDGINKVEIADMSEVYTPTAMRGKFIFHIHKFLNIFNDNYNLPKKIQDAYEKLSQSKF